MKSGSLLYLIAAGLAGGRAVASSDWDAVRDGENFQMGLLMPRQTGTNLQVFTGALGVKASAITNTGDPQRPFEVDGDTFNDFLTAATRACDNQFNTCAQIANNKTGSFSVGDCDKQNVNCKNTAKSAPTQSFPPPALFSSNAEFDFFC